MEVLHAEKQVPSGTGDRFFLWSVVLLLMTGACVASWMLSFYVVDHPEDPRCYRILKRLKRVEAPKRFRVTAAPKGDFLGAAKLLDRYGKLGPIELARENGDMLRAFVMNFRETKSRVPYIAGRFQVVQSYDLGQSDMFPSGVVAIAQAENLPQVLVEYIFPAAPQNVATIREVLVMGADIALERSHDLWALIHVERHNDGRMQFTVVPLPYGGWQLKKQSGSFTLQSPEELLKEYQIDLNIAAGLPVVRDPRLGQGLAEHRTFRRKVLAGAGDDQAALAGPELVRFEPDETRSPEAVHDQEARGTVVEPKPNVVPAGTVSGVARRPGFARPVPTPAPAVPLPPRPVVLGRPAQGLIGATPAVPTPPRPAPEAAKPAALTDTRPPARVLSVSEAGQLVDKYGDGEAALLSGDFVVTGVLGRRVALRSRISLRDPEADPTVPGNSAALVVVDFPEGVVPPARDSTVTRDSAGAFVVRDVIRGRNGQITIVAMERPSR
jgi:hypothetical protein